MEVALDSSDSQTDVENTDDDQANENDIKESQKIVFHQEIEGSLETQSFTLKNNSNSLTENVDQATLIEKLKKEKRQLQENVSRFRYIYTPLLRFNKVFSNFRCVEELQAYEMKANNLNNVRSKLESTLDDLEDELQMEKKAKILMDKVKRKLEGDLNRSLEALDEKEN